MTICWFGIYKSEYPRNDVFLSGLRQIGVQVVECRENNDDKLRYFKLIKKLRKIAPVCDLIYAAYPSPVSTIIAKFFTTKKVATDAFFSMYDAVVNDRREIPSYHPRAIKLILLDWLSVVLADIIIVDTKVHAKYWSRWPLVQVSKIKTIPIGANPKLIYPLVKSPIDIKKTTVTFHGNYIPLQGVDKIIRAINLLKGEKQISFRMIGSGQDFLKAQNLIKDLGLESRIEIIPRIPHVKINDYLNATDIILGIFGDSEKAKRVVPNKVYEGIAVGRAVVSMDTPAMREVFTAEEICFVDAEPFLISQAILKLHRDYSYRQSLSRAGYLKFIERFTPTAISKQLLDCLIKDV